MKTSKENKNKQHDRKPLKDKTIKTYMNKNLETEPPLAEKDEVKKAEERTMKSHRSS